MNKERRKAMKNALAKINEAMSILDEARNMVEEIRDAEEEAYDNMPDGIQESERGCQMQDNIDNIECIMDELEERADMDDINYFLEALGIETE